MVFIWNTEYVDIAVNEDDLTVGYYHETLMRLRNRLADDFLSCRTSRRRPILPEYNSSNTTNIRWFRINLHLNPTTRVTLMLRRDDLYVVGYGVNDQRWREFQERGRDTPLINGAEFLGFTGNYAHLRSRAGQALVGRDALVEAARDLANAAADDDTVARSLLVMITMLSEAARFLPIQQFVSDNFIVSASVQGWIVDLEHIWGKLCGYVLYYSRHPHEQWVTQTLIILKDGWVQTVVVTTIEDMLEYLGILQNSPKKIQPAPKSNGKEEL